MIPLRRLSEPAVLAEKRDEWQAKYDERRSANPKVRPESKQYAHRQVVETLEAMSHGKCFYCEGQGTLEVDHYIEVAERGDLVFAWENLYLACKDCQRKMPNASISVTDCVDPCDPAIDPAEHLQFDAEFISFRTLRGELTIKKYCLKRKLLESDRRRMLQRFNTDLLEIGKTKPWPTMDAAERERLIHYGRADGVFSLMFRAYLSKHGIAER